MRFVSDDLFCAQKSKNIITGDENEASPDIQTVIDSRQSEAGNTEDAVAELSEDGDEAETGCLEVAYSMITFAGKLSCLNRCSIVLLQVLHANLAPSRRLKHRFFEEEVMV